MTHENQEKRHVERRIEQTNDPRDREALYGTMAQISDELRLRFPDARFSRCYRNPAFGFEGPDFYNAVTGFSTTLPVEALLPSLREIEVQCGRDRADPPWAPRKMDLDLLLYGDVVGEVALPLAGLMSDRGAPEVAEQIGALGRAAAQRLGVTIEEPFMQLSFIALSVIPELRLTDGGVVDVERFTYVPVEVG